MKRLLHKIRHTVRNQIPARKLLAVLVSVALPASSLASAGRVNFAIGQVTSTDKDGKQRRLVRGSRINSGDTIVTTRGRAQLRFSDGGYTSLAPNTEFRIDEYNDSKEESTARSFFSLLKGGMRTITGAIGKLRKKSYRLTTPVATIGIRGTEFVALFSSLGLVLNVGDGKATVDAGGEITEYETGVTVNVPFAGSKSQETSQQASIPPPGAPEGSSEDDYDYSRGDDVNDDGNTAGLIPEDVGRSAAVGDNGPLYAISTVFAFAYDGGEGCCGGPAFDTDLQSRGSLEENEPVDGLFVNQDKLLAFTFDGPDSDTPYDGVADPDPDQIVDTGVADGQIGWGRWTDGTVILSPPKPVHPLHYVIGLPTAEVPTTGSADYLFAGGTNPTLKTQSNGLAAIGTINSASYLHADFSLPNNQVTAHLFTTMEGNNFTSTIPMKLGEGADRFTFSNFNNGLPPGTTFGGNCYSGCQAFAQGLFAGPGASHSGLAYKHGTGNYNEYVLGSVGFRRGVSGSAPPVPAGFPTGPPPR